MRSRRRSPRFRTTSSISGRTCASRRRRRRRARCRAIEPRHVTALEDLMDRLSEELAPLENFVLPGGTPSAAQLHVARTVCRRAERVVIALSRAEKGGTPHHPLLESALRRPVRHGAAREQATRSPRRPLEQPAVIESRGPVERSLGRFAFLGMTTGLASSAVVGEGLAPSRPRALGGPGESCTAIAVTGAGGVMKRLSWVFCVLLLTLVAGCATSHPAGPTPGSGSPGGANPVAPNPNPAPPGPSVTPAPTPGPA